MMVVVVGAAPHQVRPEDFNKRLQCCPPLIWPPDLINPKGRGESCADPERTALDVVYRVGKRRGLDRLYAESFKKNGF